MKNKNEITAPKPSQLDNLIERIKGDSRLILNDKKIFVATVDGIFISTKKSREEINQLKATLESPEFTRYIRITGKDFSGGYKSITTKQIKNFAFGEMKKFDLFS